MNIAIIQSYNLVIFGIKGDLSRRKLIPALYQLEEYNYLHKNTRIIGIARGNLKYENYIQIILQSLKTFYKKKIKLISWNRFKNRLIFFNLDICKIQKFFKLKNILLQNNNTNIYYLAVPPNKFSNICEGLGKIEYNIIPNRIIVEKPIGTSLYSSKKINHKIGKYFKEKQIFRIDHYLGKETILNLLALRFSNPLFYNNWNYKTVKYIKIIIAEKVGIEGRWGYFDKIGQMRDMVQNHLLQILSIIAMSPPKTLTDQHIQEEKIKVLKKLRKIDINNITQNTLIGQYDSGIIDGKFVPSYLNERDANKNSQTETFVSIKTYIDNDQWKNIPFYLTTGKRLFDKKSEIIICFKNISKNLFKNNSKNILKIRLEPNEGIEINFLNKVPDLNSKYTLENQKLNFNYRSKIKQNNISDAYEKLLLESMKNNQTLFVSKQEIEASWIWVDSIINAWSHTNTKPTLYKSGSWGPNLHQNFMKMNYDI
ncbi:glucose-6-phosphate dehydrogenase [Buchnera aphidicola]|uniref:glucose-6-phosphate dehydrogenase n=1 Tax=Buchnera aphidicola TaxID=9 RepID=UPI0034648CE2